MGIQAKNVGKYIGSPNNKILHDINLNITDGEFIALTGRSGSGKSTLMYLLSSLDRVSEGCVEIEGNDISQMKAYEVEMFRNLNVGFVFQFHYLIAELSAIENILLPAKKTKKHSEKKEFAQNLLEQFGLGDKTHRLPSQLSGGEQQRVAIARSLIMEPKYLFADEPTGSLDSVNGEQVIQILQNFNIQQKTTIIMVTHDPDFAKYASRQVQLADGRIIKS